MIDFRDADLSFFEPEQVIDNNLEHNAGPISKNLLYIKNKKHVKSNNIKDSHSKKSKSTSKKLNNKLHNVKYIGYESYLAYEHIKKLNHNYDKSLYYGTYYNYTTFNYLVKLIFAEILTQMFRTSEGWYIKHLGSLNFKSFITDKINLPDGVFRNVYRFRTILRYNKVTNKYVKRFSLKLSDKINIPYKYLNILYNNSNDITTKKPFLITTTTK